jgi:nucleotide-binding universal stress UspA family protein
MALFSKILVPIDFSSHSNLALEYACAMAQRFEAQLVMMHALVIPTYPLPEGYVVASPETVAELLHKTNQALEEAKARAMAMGAKRVETLSVEGVAFTAIVQTARERGCDLIVMGTHGRTGLKHALLGSVTEKVVRKAHCAVLTVRDEEHKFEKP